MILEKELIEQLADAVAGKIKPAIPLDVDLWGIAEIAAYCKRSSSHVQQRYCPRPDFPAAIRLPGGGRPLWKAAEVVEWAERYRDKKAA